MAHIKILAILKNFNQENFKDDAFVNSVKKFNEACDNKIIKKVIGDTYNTDFSRAVSKALQDLLEPYSTLCEDPKVLDFDDCTDEVIDKYNHGLIRCCVNPDGSLMNCPPRGYAYINGNISALGVGKIKSPKRNHKAKKFKIRDVKINKLFDSVDKYVSYIGYSYNDDGTKFGSFYNPMAIFTEYGIGGHYSHGFLVKDSCEDSFVGIGFYNESEKPKAPDGYKFVSVARMSDINWEELKKYVVGTMDELENNLSEMNEEDVYSIISQHFKSMDEFNETHEMFRNAKYSYNTLHIISDEGYEDLQSECDTKQDVMNRVQDVFDSLDPNDIIAIIDGHN